LHSLEGVQAKAMRWLWDYRVPLGEITILAGKQGQGKSTIAFDIAADCTLGKCRGEYAGKPKDVIIVATEDSMEHTIVPRLLAAGADLSRVYRVQMHDPGETLALPVHLAELEAACREKDVGLIILDPLMSRLHGRLDSHKDSEVRQALEPLVLLAQRLHAAVFGLMHVVKAPTSRALDAVMGSTAFTAVPRSVLCVAIDPTNERQRILGIVKANNVPDGEHGLVYTFDALEVAQDPEDGRPIIATKIVWVGETTVTIDEAFAAAHEDRSQQGAAKDFLLDFMEEDKTYEASKVIEQCMAGADCSKATVKRAKDALGIEHWKVGSPPTVFWKRARKVT
jgi:hypothetical protein